MRCLCVSTVQNSKSGFINGSDPIRDPHAILKGGMIVLDHLVIIVNYLLATCSSPAASFLASARREATSSSWQRAREARIIGDIGPRRIRLLFMD